MYEDQTQNYDVEINEEYLVHDTPFLLPHHVYCILYSNIIAYYSSKQNIPSVLTGKPTENNLSGG